MRGLAVPVRVNISGQLTMVDGEDQLKKIIMLNLADGTSENPFQELGVATGVVFGVSDQRLLAVVRQRISRLFQRLRAEGRARLAPGYPKFSVNSAAQELIADIHYQNLETEMEEDLSLAFGGALSGGPATI